MEGQSKNEKKIKKKEILSFFDFFLFFESVSFLFLLFLESVSFIFIFALCFKKAFLLFLFFELF